MAKRKITVTVDAELVEAIRGDDAASLSAVVNAALAGEVARRALRRLVADLEQRHGPVSPEDEAWASELFDQLDGITTPA